MSRRVRLAIATSATAALVTVASAASAYCPSYSPSSAFNDHGCAIQAVPGTNPGAAEWESIFALVSLGPAGWGDAGPTVDDIGQGCGQPEPLHNVPARFPCELLKAIAMQESGWRQFCVPDTPSDEVGGAERTIISFDCGYGVGQVTSGMHVGEAPDFDRDRVAADATYNLATGTRILASKWKATECVGDNQPTIIEHWYEATWAYNGLAYVNNPNNPNYDPGRGVWDPDVGGAAPYQEKVFGWMEYAGGSWAPVAVAYPNPGDIGGGSSPPTLPEPSCASPTDCVATRPTHATACNGDVGTGGAGGAGGAGSGGSSGNGTGGGDPTGGAGPGLSGAGGEDPLDATPSNDGDCACRAVGAPALGGATDRDAPRGPAIAAALLMAAIAARPGRRRAGARR